MTAEQTPDIEAMAVRLCNADQSWEHHDQTDDHPCSRCKRQAPVLAAAVREARAAAWDEGVGAGHRAGVNLHPSSVARQRNPYRADRIAVDAPKGGA